ncbi:AsnC family transcriptional regulator [Cupriavidus laharis]|uniref:AsnC family transcriptional regulator n=1 Tax=Cupriavidus laharis TaxID=151654 RepID=UPI00296232A3|nr:AsnC family transcriptional regulator [Cupriavidus laharis]
MRLAADDPLGAMEWVLANARRTGLALQQLRFDAEARHLVNATLTAAETDLLHLFVRRLGNGMDVEVLLADFGEEDLVDAIDGRAIPASFEPALALHA